MQKYLTYGKLQLLKYLEYRGNLIIDILLSFLGIVVILFVWNSIYRSHNTLPNYSFDSLIVYYLLVVTFGKLTAADTANVISESIYKGTLATFQIRPASIRLLIFIEELATNLIISSISITFTILFLLFWPALRNAAEVSMTNFLLFIPALLMAILINYFIYFTIGIFAFWTTDVTGIRNMTKNFLSIFTGALVPLSLFPGILHTIIYITPFPYMMAFPISILTNHSSQNVIQAYLIDIFWIGILFILSNTLWNNGIKKYESIGN